MAKKPAPKKVAKPAPKKAAKPAPKKVAKPAAKKVAKPAPKKVAKPAPKKAVKKPATKSAALKVVKTIGKLLKGKKEAPKAQLKAKEAQAKAKEAQAKAKEAQAKAKEAAKQAKEKEKLLKKAAKEKEIADAKLAKQKEKEDKKAEKNAEKNKGKAPVVEAAAEKPRRGRESEDLELFGDDFSEGGEDIDDLGDFDFDDEDTPKAKRSSLSELDSLESRISEEITNLAEHFDWKEIHDAVCTLDFFVDSKSDECMEKGCDNLRTTQGYCRLHYIKNFKTIKRKKEILREGKLQDYITELISKYPPKFIEQMLSDLTDDREFYKVLNDLGITTNYNYEDVEEGAVAEEDDDDVMMETRTIVTTRIGYDDEDM
jgi:chemotaxis protein histidine kinase CheA